MSWAKKKRRIRSNIKDILNKEVNFSLIWCAAVCVYSSRSLISHSFHSKVAHMLNSCLCSPLIQQQQRMKERNIYLKKKQLLPWAYHFWSIIICLSLLDFVPVCHAMRFNSILLFSFFISDILCLENCYMYREAVAYFSFVHSIDWATMNEKKKQCVACKFEKSLHTQPIQKMCLLAFS